jgi:hypothetical protein
MIRDAMIDRLRDAMNHVRRQANGQRLEGFIVLPVEAYNDLYYAAFDVKKALEAEKAGKQ